MIDAADFNRRLVGQDELLRTRFAALMGAVEDVSRCAIADLVDGVLAAINRRQLNQILLSLQAGR